MREAVPDLMFPITWCVLETETTVLVALKQNGTTKATGTMTLELSRVLCNLQGCCLPLQQQQVFL